VSTQEREWRFGPALLIALLAVSLLAAIVVYHARTANLALEVTRIERLLGTGKEADFPVALEFFVRFDEPDALVEIVGSGDAPVRTLAAGVSLASEERIACTWDGRDDEGDPVPPGNYRLHVVLPDQDRDMVFPQRILVRQPGGGPDAISQTVLTGPPCQREPGGEPLQ
jgi:hypothetical protein